MTTDINTHENTINVNVGLIGHVDSGKTTLAKALSVIASTAAFDKNPQSRERGITIDLGFSSFIIDLPEKTKENLMIKDKKFIQFTLVDCPGHASFLKTIIGGSKIIDFAICIVDITHGIQTQTSECILLTEILEIPIIIIMTKLDLIKCDKNNDLNEKVIKMKMKINKLLKNTWHCNSEIIAVDLNNNINNELIYNIESLKIFLANYYKPKLRNLNNDLKKFLFAVDHCFNIKGHGTVVTGTVIDGMLNVKDTIMIPSTNDIRKVKSIQVFRKNVENIYQGDRAGICISQFDSNNLERGIISSIGVVKYIKSFICEIYKIKYYKMPIINKQKFHISISYDTIIGTINLFNDINYNNKEENKNLDYNKTYITIDKLENKCFAYIVLNNPILYANTKKIIGIKLDQEISKKLCRIAFNGNIIETYTNENLNINKLIKIIKIKTKIGYIDRIQNDNIIIVKEMFKKESVIDKFIGFKVKLSTGEIGIIENKFGKTGKIKVYVKDNLLLLDKQKYNNEKSDILLENKSLNISKITVNLTYKQYVYGDKKVENIL